VAGRRQVHARVFAALGGEVRLRLVSRLCDGGTHSISQLTTGSRLTRQAVTKHLRVLEGAGIVRSIRAGRERRFRFAPEPIDEVREYLASVAAQWDETLARLKAFVES
jgi:DNA-binding transcriptional ArsR family regulator